jgi:hypothetical protein
MWNTLLVTYLAAGTDANIPNGSPTPPPGLATLTNTVVGWIKWGVLAAGVIGILICAGMIILGRRNRNQMAIEGMIGGAWVLGGLAMASVAAVLVGAFKI